MPRSRWSHLFTRKTRPAAGRRRTVRPAVEALEERALLTAAVQGILDPTFGPNHNGLVTTTFNSVDTAVAIDHEGGKIVAAGNAFVNGQPEFALARYNADGSLDTSFGSGGEVLTDFTPLLGPGGSAEASAVAIQSDGKIVVAGFADNAANSTSDFAVARYNPDGTLDNSFGNQGRVVIDFSSVFGAAGPDQAHGLAVQADGKIVVAGQADDPGSRVWDFALARLTPQGNLDSSFGANGLVVTNVSQTLNLGLHDSAAQALVLQGDGKVVAAGYASDAFKADFGLARYNADGSLDRTFNSTGTVATSFGTGGPEGNDVAYGVAMSGNGIVAAGSATPNAGGGAFRFAVARYTAGGQLDTSFAGTGKVETQISTDDIAKAVVVQADGKIVAGGRSLVADPNVPNAVLDDFSLARYNVDGSLDATFNPGGPLPGTVTTSFGPNTANEVSGLALQDDGKIVAGGLATDSNGMAFGLARYQAAPVTVTISGPGSVVEGDRATFTITRSDTNGPASVNFSVNGGTARPGTDFLPFPARNVISFAPGQASAAVTVTTLDDNVAGDGTKTMNLALSNPFGVALGDPSTAVLDIQEPAAQAMLQFGQASFTVGENGGSINIPVTRTGDSSGPASVTEAVTGGSATPGRDFLIANPTVNFAAGQTQASVAVNILNDGTFDGNETVNLALTNPSNAAVGAQGTAVLTINETNPHTSPAEGQALGALTFGLQYAAAHFQHHPASPHAFEAYLDAWNAWAWASQAAQTHSAQAWQYACIYAQLAFTASSQEYAATLDPDAWTAWAWDVNGFLWGLQAYSATLPNG
jgi:uncharacterized delta-60 repeat protein